MSTLERTVCATAVCTDCTTIEVSTAIPAEGEAGGPVEPGADVVAGDAVDLSVAIGRIRSGSVFVGTGTRNRLWRSGCDWCACADPYMPAKHSADDTKQLLGPLIAEQLPEGPPSTLNLPSMLVNIDRLAKGFPTQAS